MGLEISDLGRHRMVETGRALYTIREKRLFRGDYPTFEDYIRERWNVPMSWVETAIEFYLARRN